MRLLRLLLLMLLVVVARTARDWWCPLFLQLGLGSAAVDLVECLTSDVDAEDARDLIQHVMAVAITQQQQQQPASPQAREPEEEEEEEEEQERSHALVSVNIFALEAACNASTELKALDLVLPALTG